MKVKVCSAEDSLLSNVDENLEKKIQRALDEMQEQGLYLKHIVGFGKSKEKTAILIFDDGK